MPLVSQSYVLVCHTNVICMSLAPTRTPFVCHSYVLAYYLYAIICHSYVILMYLYVILCHSYVPVCHSYNTRMWSYAPACHSYVLVFHPYVTRCFCMSSVCHSYVLVCHPYVTRIYLYDIRVSLVCGFTMNIKFLASSIKVRLWETH